jgi:hypothetical protein
MPDTPCLFLLSYPVCCLLSELLFFCLLSYSALLFFCLLGCPALLFLGQLCSTALLATLLPLNIFFLLLPRRF